MYPRVANIAVPRAIWVLSFILCLPLVIWVAQWGIAGWIPQGDEALIAMKTLDVFSAHPPLLGMRSTSSESIPGAYAHHPGPIQFYLSALPYVFSGSRAIGLLCAQALIAATFIVVSLRQSWCVARWRGVLIAAASVIGVELYLGSALVLPWNIYPPILGFLLILITAWRLVRNDLRGLPWFVVSTSFVLQSNLFYVPTLALLLIVLSVIGMVRWHARRGAFWPMRGSVRARNGQPVWRRPSFVAFVIGTLLWTPSIIELFKLHPNNAQELGLLASGTFKQHALAGVFGILVLIAGLIVLGKWVKNQRKQITLTKSALLVVIPAALGLGAALAAGGSSRLHYSVMATALPFFLVGVMCLKWLPRHPSRPALMSSLLTVALCALAVVIGPGGAAESGRAREELKNSDQARRDVTNIVRQFDRHVFATPPVEVLGGGYRTSMSSQAAVMLALRLHGSAVYAPSVWPHPEDDEQRNSRYVPSKHVLVELFDNKPDKVTVPWEWPAINPGH